MGRTVSLSAGVHLAATAGHAKTVKVLLRVGADPQQRDVFRAIARRPSAWPRLRPLFFGIAFAFCFPYTVTDLQARLARLDADICAWYPLREDPLPVEIFEMREPRAKKTVFFLRKKMMYSS